MQNLKYNHAGGIDLEYEHPVYGMIPTSTHPNDPETAALYAAAMSGDYGPIADADPLPAVPSPVAILTPRQIRLVLNAAGLRDSVEAAVAIAPRDVQDMWEFSMEYRRDDPVLTAMAAGLGITDEQLDQLFTQGAQL